MKHLMERVKDADILSQGVACKNCDNWNGDILVRTIILSAAYEYLLENVEGIHVQFRLIQHEQLVMAPLWYEFLTPA